MSDNKITWGRWLFQTVFFSLLMGALATRHSGRGFLIGGVFGGVIFPLSQWLGFWLERKNVPPSVRQMISMWLVFPSILIACGLRDSPSVVWQFFPSDVALGLVMGVFVYITQEVDWRRR